MVLSGLNRMLKSKASALAVLVVLLFAVFLSFVEPSELEAAAMPGLECGRSWFPDPSPRWPLLLPLWGLAFPVDRNSSMGQRSDLRVWEKGKKLKSNLTADLIHFTILVSHKSLFHHVTERALRHMKQGCAGMWQPVLSSDLTCAILFHELHWICGQQTHAQCRCSWKTTACGEQDK